MDRLHPFLIAFLLLVPQITFGDSPQDAASTDARTTDARAAKEQAAGFRSLFDGTDLEGWKHAGNWEVVNGAIARTGSGGDIAYTRSKVPDNFELRFEWKVAPSSNSGIYYRPTQYEYQVLDNAQHRDGTNPRSSAASLYYCMPPSVDATQPAGEWNSGRVVCKGTVIQHWLNGKKVVGFDYTDPRWESHVELLRRRGGDLTARGANLRLQDHGDPVWYRNIRIRELSDDAELDVTPVTPVEISAELQAAEQARVQGIERRRAAAP